jgi:hypothetical protein
MIFFSVSAAELPTTVYDGVPNELSFLDFFSSFFLLTLYTFKKISLLDMTPLNIKYPGNI